MEENGAFRLHQQDNTMLLLQLGWNFGSHQNLSCQFYKIIIETSHRAHMFKNYIWFIRQMISYNGGLNFLMLWG